MENLIQQLQVALTELVQERDSLSATLNNGSSLSDKEKIKAFRGGILFAQACVENMGRVNVNTYIDINEYCGGMEFAISGDYDVEIDVQDAVCNADYNISDEDIIEALKENENGSFN